MRTLSALVLAISLIACARDDGLAAVLVEQGPPGYRLVEGPASGPLGLDEAAGATTLPRETVAGALRTAGFKGAHSRVWERVESEFAVAIVFEVQDAEHATDFVREMADILAGMEAALPIEIEGTGDVRAYSIAAGRRSGEGDVLCHTFMFAVRSRAYEVRGCAPRIMPVEPVRVLASRQLRAATGG